jgi:hypothetical protein
MKAYIGWHLKPVTLISAGMPRRETQDHLEKTLDEMLGIHDWTQTFDQPCELLHDEIVNPELLRGLHDWLRARACNIENITVVTTHDLGVSEWWESYKQLFKIKSFSIREELFFDSLRFRPYMFQDIQPVPGQEELAQQKTFSKHFAYYGGWAYSLDDRNLLTLKISQLADHGIVQQMSKFRERQMLLNFAEWVTYYCGQQFVDEINALYDTYVEPRDLAWKCQQVVDGPSPIHDERFDFSSYQWEVDRRCFATVVRETHNDRLWPSVTEKTYRALYHHTAAMPMGYRSIELLERLGFWFPHDIIDYSYQHQSEFVPRLEAFVGSVQKLTLLPLDMLRQYWLDNFPKFQSNAELVYHLACKNRAAELYKEIT